MSYPIPQGLLVLKKREQNRPKKERRGVKKRKIRGREMRHRKSASLKWHSLPASVYCPFCLCSHLSTCFLLFNVYPNVSSLRCFLSVPGCFLLPCFFLSRQILSTSASLLLPLHRWCEQQPWHYRADRGDNKTRLVQIFFPSPSLKIAL